MHTYPAVLLDVFGRLLRLPFLLTTDEEAEELFGDEEEDFDGSFAEDEEDEPFPFEDEEDDDPFAAFEEEEE